MERKLRLPGCEAAPARPRMLHVLPTTAPLEAAPATAPLEATPTAMPLEVTPAAVPLEVAPAALALLLAPPPSTVGGCARRHALGGRAHPRRLHLGGSARERVGLH